MDVRFGNLTTQSGQQIKFEDMDKDSDGTITEQEYNAALQEYGLDSVELSTVDTNGDKQVSNEEFQIWEQKIKMEEALAPYIQQVTTDFIGANSAYAGDMTTALRELIDKFTEEYTAEGKTVSEMAAEFEAQLPAKYEEIKEEILYNTPEAQAERETQEKADIKSNVIDNVLQSAKSEVTTRTATGEAMMDDAEASTYVKTLGTQLEKAADAFIASYTGTNLESDLTAYLNEYLGSSDRSKIEDEIATWESRLSGSKWEYIDSNELVQLKDYAKELLNAAIEQGLTVTLDGYTYTNAASLEKKIDAYTEGEALRTAVEKFLDSLGTDSVKEAAQTKAIADAEAAEQAAFSALKGEDFAIDATTIDYSEIPGYYDNTQLHERGKGWGGSLEKMQDVVSDLLNNDSLKQQMKEQIELMLEAKGISFDKVETLFENVYKQPISDTVSTDGLITGRGARGFSSKGHAYCNVADAVNTFISTFNTNIATAINEMNSSSTDMDIQDIDYAQAAKDAGVNGNVKEALENGDDYTIRGIYSEQSAIYQAENLIDALETQMRRKAVSMCNANGIEFDEKIFDTMFTNTKGTTLSENITSENGGGFWFWRYRNKSTFNPSTLMTTFVNDFKTDFSAWVEAQKTE